MKPSIGWIVLDKPHTHDFPNPIHLRIQSLPPKHIYPMHTHEWHQLIYSINGPFIVKLENACHVVTRSHAIWVPMGCPHTSGSQNGTEFRNLYIAHLPHIKVPIVPTVYTVSNLLRELIRELERIDDMSADHAYSTLITTFILQQLERLPTRNFSLPWPKTIMLKKYCEAMLESPADDRSINEWGKLLGTSARTLTRKFKTEVGLNHKQWKRKLKAFVALEMLSTNHSITEISIDLGYSSVSAFTFMFREEIGCSPSEWRNKNIKSILSEDLSIKI
jgi:AraC-like DNA-binding protein